VQLLFTARRPGETGEEWPASRVFGPHHRNPAQGEVIRLT